MPAAQLIELSILPWLLHAYKKKGGGAHIKYSWVANISHALRGKDITLAS